MQLLDPRHEGWVLVGLKVLDHLDVVLDVLAHGWEEGLLDRLWVVESAEEKLRGKGLFLVVEALRHPPTQGLQHARRLNYLGEERATQARSKSGGERSGITS